MKIADKINLHSCSAPRSVLLTIVGVLLGVLLGALVLQIAFAITDHNAANLNVAISGFAYSPKQAVVRVGDTVTWTNNDSAPHTVTANDASFDSGTLVQGGVFSRTFDATGMFSYFCAMHPSMIGSVQVVSGMVTYLPVMVKAAGASTPGPPIVANGSRWSDPVTWGGQLPELNTEMTIPAGKTVVLDTSAAVRSITVLGDIVWGDQDGLELKADWITVHGPGSFRIGREGQPFAGRAIITLTGDSPNENVMGMGTNAGAGRDAGAFERGEPAWRAGPGTTAGFPYLWAPITSVRQEAFVDAIDVDLTSLDPIAEIRYTLDGAEPGPASPRYTGPIRVTWS